MANKDDWQEVHDGVDDWQAVEDHPVQDAINYGANALHGFNTEVSNYAPLAEPTRKLGNAAAAAVTSAQDLFAGNDKTFADRYAEEQLADHEQRAEMLHNAPEWAKASGRAVGLGSNLLVPGAAAETLGGRIGGTMTMAGLEMGLSNPNQLFDSQRSAEGAQFAGMMHGAGETAAHAIPQAIQGTKAWLNDFADERALKASTGWTEQFMQQYTKDRRREMGRAIRSPDAAGESVVGFFDRPESIAPKANAKRQFFGRQIGDAVGQSEEFAPTGFSGQAVADDLAKWSEENLSPPVMRANAETGQMEPLLNPADAPRRALIQGQIDYFAGLGDMAPTEAKQIRDRSYKYDPKIQNSAYALPKDINNKVKMSIGEEQMRAAERAGPDVAAQLAEANRGYSSYKPVMDAARKRAARNEGIRYISPSDYAVSAAVGIGASGANAAKSALSGEDNDWPGNLALGLGAALAHRQLRTRGSAMLSTSAGGAANLLGKVPNVDVFRSTGSAIAGAKASQSYDDAETDYYRRQMLSPTRP